MDNRHSAMELLLTERGQVYGKQVCHTPAHTLPTTVPQLYKHAGYPQASQPRRRLRITLDTYMYDACLLMGGNSVFPNRRD